MGRGLGPRQLPPLLWVLLSVLVCVSGAGGGRPLEPVLLPVGAQVMAAGAQYLCYSFEDTPQCTPSGCSAGAHHTAGDIATTTISPGATLAAIGCSGAGPVVARVVQYPLRAGTPTLIPPAGLAPPVGITVTSPLALVLCYTLDGTNPSCDPWRVPHCLAGQEVTSSSARVALPVGPCTVKAVGCALGGGSGLIQGEFVGRPRPEPPEPEPEPDPAPPFPAVHPTAPPPGAEPPPPTPTPTAAPAPPPPPDREEAKASMQGPPLSAAAVLPPPPTAAPTRVSEPNPPPSADKVECQASATTPSTALPPEVHPRPAVPVAMVQPGLGTSGATLLTLISSTSGCLCYVLDGSLPVCGAEGFTCSHGVAGYGGAVAVVLPAKHLRLAAVACTPDGPSDPLQVAFAAPPPPQLTPAVGLLVACAVSVAAHAAGWLWRRMRWRGGQAPAAPPTAVEEALERVQQMQWWLEEEGEQRHEEEAQRQQQIGKLQAECRTLSTQCSGGPLADAERCSSLDPWERAVQRSHSAAEAKPS